MTITLSVGASINGRRYGPGPVTVLESMAADLLGNQQHYKDNEAQLFQPRSHIITGYGKPIQVANELFNESLGQIIQGNGAGLVART